MATHQTHRMCEAPTNELSRAKVEWEAVVVIEPPDTMGSSRFEHVELLETAHEREVAAEQTQHHRWEVLLREETDLVQAAHPHHKAGLVPGAVVDAHAVAETLVQVRRELNDRAVEVLWKKLLLQLGRSLTCKKPS